MLNIREVRTTLRRQLEYESIWLLDEVHVTSAADKGPWWSTTLRAIKHTVAYYERRSTIRTRVAGRISPQTHFPSSHFHAALGVASRTSDVTSAPKSRRTTHPPRSPKFSFFQSPSRMRTPAPNRSVAKSHSGS